MFMEYALLICIKVKLSKILMLTCKKYGSCQEVIKFLTENYVFIMNRFTKDLTARLKISKTMKY